MRRFIAKRYDKIVLGTVGLILAASWGMTWSLRSDRRRIKSIPVAMHLTKSDFQSAISPGAAPAKSTWSNPAAQSTGKEWVFEVFTPPVVFYDPRTAVFFGDTPNGRFRVGPRIYAGVDRGET
jgi:hypothetical protein